MSATIYSDIRAAFMTRLLELQGVPTIITENLGTTQVIDVPSLSPSIMFGEPSQAELGDAGRNWEIGIFQVLITRPMGEGPGPGNDMAGSIRSWFKRGTVLVYNGVTITVRKSYASPARNTDTGYVIPVTVSFYCQSEN